MEPSVPAAAKGFQHLERRVDPGLDRRPVVADQLCERAGDVRTDRPRGQHLLGQHDAVDQMRSA